MNIYINGIKWTLRKTHFGRRISIYKNNVFCDFWENDYCIMCVIDELK